MRTFICLLSVGLAIVLAACVSAEFISYKMYNNDDAKDVDCYARYGGTDGYCAR